MTLECSPTSTQQVCDGIVMELSRNMLEERGEKRSQLCRGSDFQYALLAHLISDFSCKTDISC
jgi:hypothetical protein